jgi:hypothetical protein
MERTMKWMVCAATAGVLLVGAVAVTGASAQREPRPGEPLAGYCPGVAMSGALTQAQADAMIEYMRSRRETRLQGGAAFGGVGRGMMGTQGMMGGFGPGPRGDGP